MEWKNSNNERCAYILVPSIMFIMGEKAVESESVVVKNE